MYCKHCGKEIDDNSTFCKYCGKLTEGNNDGFSFKFPKLGVKSYFYLLWFCIHFCLFMFGGQGKTVTKSDGWYSSYTITYKAQDYLYPNGPIKIWWGTKYYDFTDFIFYAVIVPLVLYVLYKLYRKKK